MTVPRRRLDAASHEAPDSHGVVRHYLGALDGTLLEPVVLQKMAGRGGYSFQLWTVMNAVLWHASWIEGREDCL